MAQLKDLIVTGPARIVGDLRLNGTINGFTLGCSVPSNAVFTDTSTNYDGHYTPSGSAKTGTASGSTLGFGGAVVTGLTYDGKGHVTGFTTSKLPSNPNTDTDTKNTAGSTNSTSKLFLVGAASQDANPQTYSNSGCYTSGGHLYSNSKIVITDAAAAAGTNIGTVGTPSVTTSVDATGKATFTFNNLKGEKGDPGTNGSNGSDGSDGSDGYNMLYSGQNGTSSTTSIPKANISNNSSLKVGDLVLSKSGCLYKVNTVSTDCSVTYLCSLKGATGSNGTNGTNATTTSVVSSSANGLAPKVISTNTTKATSDYYVLASSDGTTTPSWYKLPDNAFNNTEYTSKTAESGGTDVSLVTTGEKYTWNNQTKVKCTSKTTTKAPLLACGAGASPTSGTAYEAYYDPKVFLNTLSGGLEADSIFAPSAFFQESYSASDERLKNFGEDIKVDFDKLAALKKKYFVWKDDENCKNQIGVSAQEIQEIYPELVSVNESTGYLSVSYDKLSVVALKAVDELYEKNKELEARLERLEKLLSKE